MGLYMKQSESRSQLQDKLAKELQERAREKAKTLERPDGVTDSAYLRGTTQTTRLAWVWILGGLAIVCIAVWLIAISL